MYKKITAPQPLRSLVRGLRSAEAAKAYDSDTKIYRLTANNELKLVDTIPNPWGQKFDAPKT